MCACVRAVCGACGYLLVRSDRGAELGGGDGEDLVGEDQRPLGHDRLEPRHQPALVQVAFALLRPQRIQKRGLGKPEVGW